MPSQAGARLRSRSSDSPTRPTLGRRHGHPEPHTQTSTRTRVRQAMVIGGTAATT